MSETSLSVQKTDMKFKKHQTYPVNVYCLEINKTCWDVSTAPVPAQQSAMQHIVVFSTTCCVCSWNSPPTTERHNGPRLETHVARHATTLPASPRRIPKALDKQLGQLALAFTLSLARPHAHHLPRHVAS